EPTRPSWCIPPGTHENENENENDAIPGDEVRTGVPGPSRTAQPTGTECAPGVVAEVAGRRFLGHRGNTVWTPILRIRTSPEAPRQRPPRPGRSGPCRPSLREGNVPSRSEGRQSVLDPRRPAATCWSKLHARW